MKKLLLTSGFLFSIALVDNMGGIANAQGSFAWAAQLGGSNYDQSATVKVDGSGNVYTIGSFGGTADFDPGSGVANLTTYGGTWDQDIFISKLDASGNFVWAKQVGGTNYDYGASFDVDAAGNVYIVGSFYGTIDADPGAGVFNLSTLAPWNNEIYVIKLDASGSFVWGKRLGGVSSSDYYYGYPGGIAVDGSGNVYTTGSFQGLFDFDPGAALDTITSYSGMWGPANDVFVSKLDASGNFVWAKRFGGTEYDNISGIAVNTSGDVFTTGSLQEPMDMDPGSGVFMLTPSMGTWGYNQNVFISKLNSAGDFAWAKQIGGEQYAYPSDITTDTAGNVYTIGTYEGETDFNPGTPVYNLTPGGSEWNSDMFVLKLDKMGNFGWARAFGGPSYENANGVIVDVASNVYVTGSYEDSVDFNPRAGVYLLGTSYMWDQDIFACKLDDAGSFVWAKRMGGTSYDQGASIAVDKIDRNANVYISGMFEGTADLDPGAGILNFTTFGGSWDQDVFTEKLHDTLSTVSVAEHLGHGLNGFDVYPNPSTGAFTLAMNLEADSKLNVEVVDLTGRLIRTISQSKMKAGVNTISVDESELPNGVYFVRIYGETINSTIKFVINK